MMESIYKAEQRRREAGEAEAAAVAEAGRLERKVDRIRFRQAKVGGGLPSFDVLPRGQIALSPVDSFAGLDVAMDSVITSESGVWYVLALSYGAVPAWTIHRTHQDFAALAETLVAKHPQLAHVPFPPAYSYGEGWESVISERKVGLVAFLVQCLSFPKSPVLDSFLEFSFHVVDFVALRYQKLYNSVRKIRRKRRVGPDGYEEYEEYEIDVDDLDALDHGRDDGRGGRRDGPSGQDDGKSRAVAAPARDASVQTDPIDLDHLFSHHLERMQMELLKSMDALRTDTDIALSLSLTHPDHRVRQLPQIPQHPSSINAHRDPRSPQQDARHNAHHNVRHNDRNNVRSHDQPQSPPPRRSSSLKSARAAAHTPN